MRLAAIAMLVSLHHVTAQAQQQPVQRKEFTRLFFFSITPAFGTNGMHPGGYTNHFSFHLTSGYSAANYGVEVALISNLNENETRGFQLAGLTNFTGANAFAGMTYKELDKKVRSGYEANFTGIQLSGMGNVVLNNAFGWQTTGGANVVKGGLIGFQLAGVSNLVRKYSFGIQLAGLSNTSVQSIDGVQLAGLINITRGELNGIQMAMFNSADFIDGKNSFEKTNNTGLQLGVWNRANKMNGFQVGLINVGKRMQGTQIGLINFYNGGKMPETPDGTSIGLINIGATGYFALYATELFATTVEIATGTVKNARITSAARTVEIQNVLIYANNPGFIKGKERWAIGYGIKKMYFTRSSAPGMGKFRYFSLGVDWLHLNRDRKTITKDLSLITRPAFEYGTRLHPKLRSVYLFGAITYNFYLSDAKGERLASFLESNTTVRNSNLQSWPGFRVGVHVQ